MASPTLYLDVFSDYVCPFSYLQTRVLDQFGNAYGDAVEFRWHAFELRPEPAALLDPDAEELHDLWEKAVYPLANERDLPMRLPSVQPRSRKAHETAFFARDAGLFDPVHRAIFKAFFEDGIDIGEADVLIDIASACGVDPEMLEEALANDTYTDAVIEDQAFATKLGITSVPFVVLSRDPAVDQEPPRPIALRGAAPVQHFEAALERLFPDGFPEG